MEKDKVKGIVDIVFLLDATGSMNPSILALKKNIEMFIKMLTATDANNTCIVKDWRAKVVGYRDYEYSDTSPFVDNSFVRDGVALKDQLDALEAIGGGDEPESLLDALYKVATMGSTEKQDTEDANKWRYRSAAARVVIVFTDASYKETIISIPEAEGGTVDDVINKLHENRIILSIFAPDMDCYDTLCEADKAQYEAIDCSGKSPVAALADFTTDEKNFTATLEALAKSVSKSADVTAL